MECKLPLRMEEGFQAVASTDNTDCLFQRAHRKVSHESVEPSMVLNSGGAQDLFPALGWRCRLQNSNETNPRKTHRRTTTVPSHPQQQCFTLRPPATPIHYCCDAHNLRLVALCNSGLRQVVLDFFVLINEHRIYGCEEHACLPFMTFFHPESIQTG